MLNLFITNEKLQLFVMIPVLLGAFYVAWRIICTGTDTPRMNMNRSRPRIAACIALTALGTICLAYIFLSHLEFQIKDASLNRILVWISGIYVSFFLYFLLVLTATDILCLILRHKGNRKMPARLFKIVSAGMAVLLTVTGVMHARSIQTRHYDLTAEKTLSAPIRIVEVSDLHMGSVVGTAHVQRVVDAVNACRPDLVVFLGDQFNRTGAEDVVDAEAMFESLSHIRAKLGVYAVLGNHDPELNSEIYQKFLLESDITALDNGVLEIIPGSKVRRTEIRTLINASSKGSEAVAAPKTSVDGAIFLAGRTKLAVDAERVPLTKLLDEAGVMHGFDSGAKAGGKKPRAAGSGPDRNDYYLMVLDHDPEGIAEAASCGADLVLAGHTHRGQYFPATVISRFLYGKGFSYGLARTPDENTGHITTSIVSSGAGYFQIPIRVGTDSEIVCVDLRFDSHK